MEFRKGRRERNAVTAVFDLKVDRQRSAIRIAQGSGFQATRSFPSAEPLGFGWNTALVWKGETCAGGATDAVFSSGDCAGN